MTPAKAAPGRSRTRSAPPNAEPEQPSACERILDAAVERIASDGIDDVRIARIAMDAGVSTSLVHYHFATRDALLAEALEHSFQRAGDTRIGEAEGRDHKRRLATMIDQCLPLPGRLEREWILWLELWLRAGRHPELRPTATRLYARMHEWLRAEIEAGVTVGEFSPSDADALADRVLALCDGLGTRALLGDPTVTLERARQEVWEAIAADLGLRPKMPAR
jgi:AcrR family transcriptional regulator